MIGCMIIILILISFILFKIYIKEDLYRKRNELLQAIHSYDDSVFMPSSLIAELRQTDLLLFGGCKQKNKYIRCNTCSIKDCPRNSTFDKYYSQFDHRPKPPRIFS